MFLGIDLGTTYSVGAFINKDGEAEVITNAEGSRITPSVVYIESEDSVIVGQTAKNMAASFPNDVIALAKNYMGKVRKDGTPEDFLTTKGVFAPEYISAQVLMKVVSDAETYLNCDEIKDVVVTIPYTFDDSARKATEDAIRIAGLNRLAMINEPTAAAFYYATKLGINDSNVLVYDLGGGTFDVTIIHIDSDGNCTVIGGGGRSRIGGSTLDANLAKDICQEINLQYGIDVTTPEYNDVYQEILTKVEQAKITLSSANQTVIPLRIGSNAINIPLTREELNEKVKTVLYDVTEIQIDKTLRESKLTVADINKVIMVGGSSRIPYIEKKLEEYFGQKPSREVNPDEVVALGAALYGRQLTDESAVKKTIVDACSHSVGIAALDPKTGEEYNDILIPKNTKLPASVEKVYAFADDGIEDIYLNVLEGERKELKFTNAICATNVKLPSKLAKGERVHLRLEIDKYQILHIYVRIPSAGNVETEISFDRKSNMSEAQISKWKKSAVKVKETAAAKASEKGGINKLKSIFGKSEDISSEEKKEPVKKKEVKKDKSQEIPKPVQTVMEGIIGMEEVKIALRNAANRNQQVKKKTLAGSKDYDDLCFAVMGESGMGISTAAEKIAEALGKLQMVSKSTPVIAYYNDIVMQDEQGTTNAIQTLFQNAMGGILIIDDFHDFYSENENAPGMVACKYLYKAYKQCGGNISLIIAGEVEKMVKLLEIRDEFDRLFMSYKIYLQGYTPAEYVEMLHMYATSRSYVVDPDADPYIESYFKNHHKDPEFVHFYSVKKLFEAARTDVANKASAKRHATDYDYSIIYLENFAINEKVKTLDELKEELNSLTGLSKAKEEINKIIKIQEKTVARAKEEGIEIKNRGSMHMIFSGSPGTGKTTVARLVGEIYRELGLLKTGQFIEVSGMGLISDVIGGSKVLVEKAVDRAIGGILFIDEAYSMYKGDNDPYGQEAVDTLVPLIENHRNELMVIMAGYTDDMERFLSTANVGLASRFNTTIEFDDYNIDELVEIFHYNLAKDEYQMEGEAEKVVRELLLEKMKNPKFGNARGVRNIYEAVCKRKDDRVGDMDDANSEFSVEYNTIRVEDIRGAGREAGKSIEELLDELNSMTGLRGVKEQVNSMVKNVMVNKEREEKGGKATGVGTMHMIFAGNAGTGKTTVARLIGEIYKKLGLLGEGRTIEVSKTDLVGKFLGDTEDKVKLIVNKSLGNVLFIDEAYTLKDDQYGKTAIDALLKAIEDYRDSMVVIIAGYEPDMLEFLNANQGLSSRFKTWVRFEDYSLDEMYEIFCNMVAAEEGDWFIADDAEKSIRALIKASASANKDFGNARGVRNVLDTVKTCLNTRIGEEKARGIDHTLEEMNTICAVDAERAANGNLDAGDEKNTEELLAELMNMTGLASVKNQVNSIINSVAMNKAREAAGMPVSDIGTMHMIFAGNAGTGKTTVARLIGKIYKNLGVLANGDTIEVARQDLIAGYVGQTAIKTQEVIDKSLGNVLFIDEAYSLVKAGQSSDFGSEAIETLLKGIEDHRKDMVVILAGYGPEMEGFLDANQGLKSRFKNWIVFEDYSSDEMMTILESTLGKEQYVIAEDAKEKVKELIAVKSQEDGFGNARGVRNIADDLKTHLANRLNSQVLSGGVLDKETLSTITSEDIF